jgi:hypothetical protein
MPSKTVARKIPDVQPIVIFPFGYPAETEHLKFLYDELEKGVQAGNWRKPMTVLNRQTERRADKKSGPRACRKLITKTWKVIPAWSVDSCQMWLAGLGAAFDRDATTQVFWLVPGDFEYAKAGAAFWKNMKKLPVAAAKNDLAVGEIEIGTDNAKHLIDTYGTFALLSNWFPEEAQAIRFRICKPRSEFLALRRSYLEFLLDHRWFPYEHTVAMLLHALTKGSWGRDVVRVALGQVKDSDQGRDRLAGALEQVERAERMIKLFWRERHPEAKWEDDFRRLDLQSGQIRAAACIVLEQLLRK